jgi:hypothetical protein
MNRLNNLALLVVCAGILALLAAPILSLPPETSGFKIAFIVVFALITSMAVQAVRNP